MSFLSSPPLVAPSAHGATESVQALRRALAEGDVDAAQSMRWLAPRPPGERDLLSDMAAAEGLSQAVARLSRFWRRATVRVEQVRSVDANEAEVYERLHMPGESLPIVSVVRRASSDAPWQVVCTNEAYDERFVLWVAERAERIDDVEWTRAFAQRFADAGDLVMDGSSGVLGHRENYDWLANVRGPFVPTAWPEHLPGEGGRVVELTAALTPDALSRHEQITWLLEAAHTFVEVLGGIAAYLPLYDKLIVPEALSLAAAGSLTPSQAFRFWSRMERRGGYVHTRGLRQLGLPEVEAPEDLLGGPVQTERLVRWMGTSLLGATAAPGLGTELVLGDRSVLVVGGRRGPRRGQSYGRWGAIAIVPSDPALHRGSRTRLRVPDDY